MAKVLMNMAKVNVSLAGRVIFENVNLELQMGQRIGLVGPNGAGKSTLMKVMAGELMPDQDANGGEVFRAPGLTVARLEQEPALARERTVLQEALTAVPQMAEIEDQLRLLEEQMSDPAVYSSETRLNKVLGRHAKLLAEQERLGGRRYHRNHFRYTSRYISAPAYKKRHRYRPRHHGDDYRWQPDRRWSGHRPRRSEAHVAASQAQHRQLLRSPLPTRSSAHRATRQGSLHRSVRWPHRWGRKRGSAFWLNTPSCIATGRG